MSAMGSLPMPARVIPIGVCREGTYVLVEAAVPLRPPQAIGVLLMDAAGGGAWVRMRRRYDDLAEPDDAEVLEALEEDIRGRVAEMGAGPYLAWLEDSLSNALRVSERQTVAVDSFTRVLDRLYT